jgi:ribosomal protein S18 acetylase RimI-like enzyme
MSSEMAEAAGDAAEVASVAELGHRNLIAYSRALVPWGGRGSLYEKDGVLAYAGGSWLPVVCNGAFRTSDSVPAALVLEAAEAFFGGRKRGYSVKVRDTGVDEDLRAACVAGGLEGFGDPEPQMGCRAPLVMPDPPPGVELARVSDAQGVADFVSINAEAYATYGMPADVVPAMFDRPDAVLEDRDVAMVVASRDGRALATAMVYVSDGTASLQWVGTRPEARQLSLGAAVTVWTTNEAFARGATSCTLQASTMGAPLYRKLGYETLYRYHEYVRWKTA